jgi:phospholipid N-methyltransferase
MIKRFIKDFAKFLGFDIVPIRKHAYIDAKEVITKAKLSGKSICEYVEELWNIKGNTDAICSRIKQSGALKHCTEVCEIGPGTGRYLERILKEVKPSYYHIFEIDPDWRDWLKNTYNVVAHPADGHSLSSLNDNQVGLVHAHGVFVYLPFLNSFEYFKEMIRKCDNKGYIVFDIYSDKEWDEKTIEIWLNTTIDTLLFFLNIELLIFLKIVVVN